MTELPIIGPTACDLVPASVIEAEIGSPVQQWSAPRPSRVGPGIVDKCLFAKANESSFSPAVQISTFPPGSSPELAKAELRDVAPLDGMDGDAFVGTLATAPAGTPPTTIVVMTDFGMYGVSTYPPTTWPRERLIEITKQAGVRYRAAIPR